MKKTKLRIFLVLIAIACFSSVFLNCAEDGKSGEDGVGVQGEQGLQGEQGPQGDVGATGPQGPQGDPGESEYPRLYVVGYNSDNICVFHNAGVAGWSYGDIYPDREIYYDLDSLSEGPFGLFLDKVYNELYVADLIANRILVFEEPDGIDAESAPDRIIWAEIGTTFTNFNPGDVLVEGNRLYISNTFNSVDDAAIIIISDANIADGETAATRELRGASTTLNRPFGLAFGDTKLFVANYNNNSVLRFDDPWILSGNNPDSLPSKTIIDASIDAPLFLCLDEVNDELYVTNFVNFTITVIQDATQASPSISRTITNFPSEPTGIAVDAEYDRLYVALSDGSIYIWKKASEVSGNVTIDAVPTRMILSDNTQLVLARDIVLDTEE